MVCALCLWAPSQLQVAGMGWVHCNTNRSLLLSFPGQILDSCKQTRPFPSKSPSHHCKTLLCVQRQLLSPLIFHLSFFSFAYPRHPRILDKATRRQTIPLSPSWPLQVGFVHVFPRSPHLPSLHMSCTHRRDGRFNPQLSFQGLFTPLSFFHLLFLPLAHPCR